MTIQPVRQVPPSVLSCDAVCRTSRWAGATSVTELLQAAPASVARANAAMTASFFVGDVERSRGRGRGAPYVGRDIHAVGYAT